MAITATWYHRAVQRMAAGADPVDWESDTIKVALLAADHTPNLDEHEFFNDVSADETSGSGYTAGGAALTSKSVSRSGARTALKAADTEWTASSGQSLSAGYAVIYKDTGNPSTSPLLGLVDFDGEKTATGAAFTLDWDDTDGVLFVEAVSSGGMTALGAAVPAGVGQQHRK